MAQRIDHTGHPHPSTPAARALCRANGGTGSIAKRGATLKVDAALDLPKAKTPTKPAVVYDFATGKTRKAPVRITGHKAGTEPVKAPPLPVAKKKRTAAPPRSASAPPPVQTKTQQDWESGIASKKSMAQGAVGQVELITTKSGAKLVRKRAKDLDLQRSYAKLSSAKRQQDSEELGSKLAIAMGLDAPEVHRISDTELVMEFKPGLAGIDIEGPKKTDLINSASGRQMALFDLITDNFDRHGGNYLSDGKGSLSPIDHGMLWGFKDRRDGQAPDEAPLPGDQNQFNRALQLTRGRQVEVGKYVTLQGRWTDTDQLSTRQIDAAQKALEGLKSEFDRLGHSDWYQASLVRLKTIRPHAKGK